MIIPLKEKDKIKILCGRHLFSIMQKILLRENVIDRNREHFWTVSLDNALRILNIELISMGTVKATLVEPMEVFSVPLQKRAVYIILVHNHPSQEVHPSKADKDITDRLIQVGNIMRVPVIDHLIITEKQYYSFRDDGLMEILKASIKYLPPFEIEERYKREARLIGEKKGKDKRSKEIARELKRNGVDINIIEKSTGLSPASIKRLKTD